MAVSTKSIDKYFEFCSENFPNSYWNATNKKDKKKDFFRNINKSIELLNILIGLHTVPENSKELIHDSINYLKRILFCAPINDTVIYSSIMRGLCESLLRIVYSSIFQDIHYNIINQMKYRELNETLSTHPIISTIMNKETKRILGFYGKYSNEVHNKKRDNKNDIRFLSEILTNESGINPDKLSSDSQCVLDYCQKVLFYVFKIDEKSLSYSAKSRLVSILK